MKNWKRIISAGLSLALGVTLLAGCGKSGGSSDKFYIGGIGPTTGVYEDTVGEIRVDDNPVENVTKGTYCSVKTKELVRRGDQVYRWIWVKDEF